jgi:hypothetical protein
MRAAIALMLNAQYKRSTGITAGFEPAAAVSPNMFA